MSGRLADPNQSVESRRACEDVTTPTLSITGASMRDAPSTDNRVVTNGCGSVTSSEASLAICEVDFNCDGAVDFFDHDEFVAAFERPC